MTKSKRTVRLAQGEALVVGPTTLWNYIADVCKELARQNATSNLHREAEEWMSVAQWIEDWVERSNEPILDQNMVQEGYYYSDDEWDDWKK